MVSLSTEDREALADVISMLLQAPSPRPLNESVALRREATSTVEDIVARHVEAAVTEARAAALNEAAGVASWMEYPASNDPRHWAAWLRNLAASNP